MASDSFSLKESVLSLSNFITWINDYFHLAESVNGLAKSVLSIVSDAFHFIEPQVLLKGTFVTTIAGKIATVYQTITALPGSTPPDVLRPLILDMILILVPTVILGGIIRQFWGVIFGAILGVGLGLIAGTLPFWFIVVVGLGTLMMLYARRDEG